MKIIQTRYPSKCQCGDKLGLDAISGFWIIEPGESCIQTYHSEAETIEGPYYSKQEANRARTRIGLKRF